MSHPATPAPRPPELPLGIGSLRFLFFTGLAKKPVCAGKIKDRIGKLTDLVFALTEPYPEAAGIYIEHGWSKPTEFVPWDRVLRIEDDAIFVKPPEQGEAYPPFVDQPGWILADKHLMGRTILDMDGRRIEVVNDVHLLLNRGRLFLIHVDTSMNGFLRRWGIHGLRWIKDRFISWKYVQPLSMEDAVTSDIVSLSVTRSQLKELPSEDLADALEELTGKEQEALFSALDPEKAAETLMESEPRARRQIIADLRKERAKLILGEMSVPQLVSLLSVLPHNDAQELLPLVPPETAKRVEAILAQHEVLARELMDSTFLTFPGETKAADAIKALRKGDYDAVSYLYVAGEDGRTLLGVVDLRDLVLAADTQTLHEIMASPVVTADEDDVHEDLARIFSKYHYRMIPVVDAADRILGVVRYNDIMRGIAARKEE